MSSYSLRSDAIPFDAVINNHLHLHAGVPRTTIHTPLFVKYPINMQPRYLVLRVHPAYLPWYPEMDRGDLGIELSAPHDGSSSSKILATYRHQNRYADETNICDSVLAVELPQGITSSTLRLDFETSAFDSVLADPDEVCQPGVMEIIYDDDDWITGYGYLTAIPSNSVLRSDRAER